MGSVNSLGMGAMDMVAGALEQAAGALEQAAGLGGGSQGQPGGTNGANGPSGPSGQQGGLGNLEQELSQTLQQLSQELQQLSGSQDGGSQTPQQVGQGNGSPYGGGDPQGGTPTSAAGPTQGGGYSSPMSGNEAAQLPDLNNLIVDSSGGSGGARPTHVGGDLDRLRGEVQSAMQSGQMSEQTGAKALADIGSGNIKAVEQDLTGGSGNVTSAAQGNTMDPQNALLGMLGELK